MTVGWGSARADEGRPGLPALSKVVGLGVRKYGIQLCGWAQALTGHEVGLGDGTGRPALF